MDKNPLQINSNSQFSFGKAQESDFLTLPKWFKTPALLREWGGPKLNYPLNAEQFFKDNEQATHYQSYALKSQEHLVAFGQVNIVKQRAHLARLCVNPSMRGQGHSKTLIHSLVRQATSQGSINLISLFVYESNHLAIRCYQKLGFIQLPAPRNINIPEGCIYMLLHRADAPTKQ
ncbi:GNAT family N-acetyltransferase [Glaciecola sp. MH2013]|uniref:GNAT family N-acetyltransferase n=1 Tax=Glaciecola sp. MH2013 TaxID=2785524 RepID=UPI00189EA39E|nr:GNAT family N-acetyltransferase [Glaciecola sp. MH2013]MBF7075013.1 GNAT family N-acetyltransferase [Glaciecola sp. MH2013]